MWYLTSNVCLARRTKAEMREEAEISLYLFICAFQYIYNTDILYHKCETFKWLHINIIFSTFNICPSCLVIYIRTQSHRSRDWYVRKKAHRQVMQ